MKILIFAIGFITTYTILKMVFIASTDTALNPLKPIQNRLDKIKRKKLLYNILFGLTIIFSTSLSATGRDNLHALKVSVIFAGICGLLDVLFKV